MMEMADYDLRSIQEARDLARLGEIAAIKLSNFTEDQIDKILQNMVRVAKENETFFVPVVVVLTSGSRPTLPINITLFIYAIFYSLVWL